MTQPRPHSRFLSGLLSSPLALALAAGVLAMCLPADAWAQNMPAGTCTTDPQFAINPPAPGSGLVSMIVIYIQGLLSGWVAGMYSSVEGFAGPAVAGAISLYVVIYGIFFTFGLVPLNVADLVIRLAKLAVIGLIALGVSWNYYNNYVVQLFNGAVDELISAISSIAMGMAPGLSATYPFAPIDNALAILLSARMVVTLIGYVFTGPYGLIYTYLILHALIVFGRCVLECLWTYLLSLVVRSLLLAFGPIFLPCILFSRTRHLFDGWLNQIMNTVFQPVFIFTYFALFAKMCEAIVWRILYVPVCFTSVDLYEGAPFNGLLPRPAIWEGGTWKLYGGDWSFTGNQAGLVFPLNLIEIGIFMLVSFIALRFNTVAIQAAKEIAGASTSLNQIGSLPSFLSNLRSAIKSPSNRKIVMATASSAAITGGLLMASQAQKNASAATGTRQPVGGTGGLTGSGSSSGTGTGAPGSNTSSTGARNTGTGSGTNTSTGSGANTAANTSSNSPYSNPLSRLVALATGKGREGPLGSATNATPQQQLASARTSAYSSAAQAKGKGKAKSGPLSGAARVAFRVFGGEEAKKRREDYQRRLAERMKQSDEKMASTSVKNAPGKDKDKDMTTPVVGGFGSRSVAAAQEAANTNVPRMTAARKKVEDLREARQFVLQQRAALEAQRRAGEQELSLARYQLSQESLQAAIATKDKEKIAAARAALQQAKTAATKSGVLSGRGPFQNMLSYRNKLRDIRSGKLRNDAQARAQNRGSTEREARRAAQQAERTSAAGGPAKMVGFGVLADGFMRRPGLDDRAQAAQAGMRSQEEIARDMKMLESAREDFEARINAGNKMLDAQSAYVQGLASGQSEEMLRKHLEDQNNAAQSGGTSNPLEAIVSLRQKVDDDRRQKAAEQREKAAERKKQGGDGKDAPAGTVVTASGRRRPMTRSERIAAARKERQEKGASSFFTSIERWRGILGGPQAAKGKPEEGKPAGPTIARPGVPTEPVAGRTSEPARPALQDMLERMSPSELKYRTTQATIVQETKSALSGDRLERAEEAVAKAKEDMAVAMKSGESVEETRKALFAARQELKRAEKGNNPAKTMLEMGRRMREATRTYREEKLKEEQKARREARIAKREGREVETEDGKDQVTRSEVATPMDFALAVLSRNEQQTMIENPRGEQQAANEQPAVAQRKRAGGEEEQEAAMAEKPKELPPRDTIMRDMEINAQNAITMARDSLAGNYFHRDVDNLLIKAEGELAQGTQEGRDKAAQYMMAAYGLLQADQTAGVKDENQPQDNDYLSYQQKTAQQWIGTALPQIATSKDFTPDTAHVHMLSVVPDLLGSLPDEYKPSDETIAFAAGVTADTNLDTISAQITTLNNQLTAKIANANPQLMDRKGRASLSMAENAARILESAKKLIEARKKREEGGKPGSESEAAAPGTTTLRRGLTSPAAVAERTSFTPSRGELTPEDGRTIDDTTAEKTARRGELTPEDGRTIDDTTAEKTARRGELTPEDGRTIDDTTAGKATHPAAIPVSAGPVLMAADTGETGKALKGYKEYVAEQIKEAGDKKNVTMDSFDEWVMTAGNYSVDQVKYAREYIETLRDRDVGMGNTFNYVDNDEKISTFTAQRFIDIAEGNTSLIPSALPPGAMPPKPAAKKAEPKKDEAKKPEPEKGAQEEQTKETQFVARRGIEPMREEDRPGSLTPERKMELMLQRPQNVEEEDWEAYLDGIASDPTLTVRAPEEVRQQTTQLLDGLQAENDRFDQQLTRYENSSKTPEDERDVIAALGEFLGNSQYFSIALISMLTGQEVTGPDKEGLQKVRAYQGFLSMFMGEMAEGGHAGGDTVDEQMRFARLRQQENAQRQREMQDRMRRQMMQST